MSLFISLLGSRRVTQRSRLKSTCTRGDLEVSLPPLLTSTGVIALKDTVDDKDTTTILCANKLCAYLLCLKSL